MQDLQRRLPLLWRRIAQEIQPPSASPAAHSRQGCPAGGRETDVPYGQIDHGHS